MPGVAADDEGHVGLEEQDAGARGHGLVQGRVLGHVLARGAEPGADDDELAADRLRGRVEGGPGADFDKGGQVGRHWGGGYGGEGAWDGWGW